MEQKRLAFAKSCPLILEYYRTRKLFINYNYNLKFKKTRIMIFEDK